MGINVGVYRSGNEASLRGKGWVVLGKLEVEKEASVLVRRLDGALHDYLPERHVYLRDVDIIL